MNLVFLTPLRFSLTLCVAVTALFPFNPSRSFAQSLPSSPEAPPPAANSPDPTETRFSFQDICAVEDSLLANTAARLATTGQFDRALQLAQDIKSPIAKPLLLVYITDQLAKAGQFDQARTLVQSLPDANDPSAARSPSSFFLSLSPFGENYQQQGNMVISFRLAAAGQPEAALALAQQVQDKTLRPVLLFAIAAQLDKQGKTTQADALLKEASLQLKGLSGFATEDLLASAAERILKQGQIETVLKMTKLLKDLYRSTPKSPNPLDSLDRTIERLETDSALKLIELGQYDRAFQLIESLPDQEVGPMQKGFLRFRLATDASKAGQIDLALKVSRLLDNDKKAFFAEPAFRNIIVSLSEQQNFDRALQLAETVTPPDTQAYAMRPIVYRLWKAGQTDRALQIVNRLSEPDLVAGGLISLAQAAIELGQTDRATTLLQDAFERLQEPSQPSVLPDEPAALQEIAISWARLGQYSQALKVVQQSTLGRLRDETLQRIALEMAKGKRYDQAIKIARTLKTQRGQTDTLVQIAAQLVQAKEYDRALKLTEQFPDKLRLESQERFSNVTRIISGENLKSVLFGVIGLSLGNDGNLDRALTILDRIPDDFAKTMMLGLMANQLYEAGQGDQGDRILNQARELARTVKPPTLPNGKRPYPVCPNY